LLGVVGPTRMQYGRAVAVVRYLTQVVNDLLAETYTETYSDEGATESVNDAVNGPVNDAPDEHERRDLTHG
jgi:hypothetical protein